MGANIILSLSNSVLMAPGGWEAVMLALHSIS